MTKTRLYALMAVFLFQGALLAFLRLDENIPARFPLTEFPAQLGSWRAQGEEALDEPTRALLQPDESFVRAYGRSSGAAGTLFVGYFKSTQANHPAPHSPTVCLPGAGWREVWNRVNRSESGGRPFEWNEYILQKGTQRLVVVYWYQNMERTWAKEVLAKVYMLPDFWRNRRTDVALVRITFLSDEFNHTSALEEAKDLARYVQPALAGTFRASVSASR
jgi:EpsI family protein